MSPQLFQRQLDDGAWGLTAATPAHLRVCRRHGVPAFSMPTSSSAAGRSLECSMNWRATPVSISTAWSIPRPASERLKAGLAARPAARPLQVLLEVGAAGGRTGVRSVEQGIALAERIARAAPEIALRGHRGHSKGSSPPTCRTAAGGSRGHAGGSRRSPLHVTGGAGSPTARSCSALAARPSSTWSRLALPGPSAAQPLGPAQRLLPHHDSLHYRHLADAMAARAIPPWRRSARAAACARDRRPGAILPRTRSRDRRLRQA